MGSGRGLAPDWWILVHPILFLLVVVVRVCSLGDEFSVSITVSNFKRVSTEFNC